MEKQNIYESKQGLKSMKLFNIVKQHGGFEEKTPSFYLHDMTDDDVIGVLPEDDLQKLMKMHVSDRNKYAIQHGFKINRGDTMEIIPLKDWTWVGVIERNHNLPNDEYGQTRIGKLKRERGDAKRRDGAHRYQWSDTGKWGSPRAEEFYMRRTQNDIANQRRQRYGDDAVYKMNESIEGLDKFATPTDVTRFTNNLIKKLYKVSQPYTSHRFRDNDWRHLKTFVEILRNVEGVEELIPAGTGPYKQSQEGAYKEYTLDITTTLGSKIGGFIRCHFCGSQENPWDVYDMTVNFYRNNEINNDNIIMNESKQGIQSKKLYDAVREHGGFGEDWKNKMYVHGITDNDIIGIYSPEEYKKFLNGKLNYRDLINNAGIAPLDELDKIRTCSFKDGFKIIYILRRNNNIETTSKKVNRGQNAPYSSGKRPYMYSDKDRQNKVNKIKNNMAKVQISENELKQIVAESVKKILSEARKPSDKTVGKHTLKGLRYDKNGNPLYTSDTMSDDEKKNQGWKFSKKHGMYGQLSDPTKLSESSTDINEAISTDYRKSLKQLLTKSFGNLDDNEKQFLYDLLNNEPWETIYIALGVLESNRINESRKKREPRKGTIELNGKHIDAVEDGLDKNGNPMYKVNDPSIKGRRCKDGSIRVQHYNFKPNRVNEGVYTFKPNAASKEKGMIDNLNKRL